MYHLYEGQIMISKRLLMVALLVSAGVGLNANTDVDPEGTSAKVSETTTRSITTSVKDAATKAKDKTVGFFNTVYTTTNATLDKPGNFVFVKHPVLGRFLTLGIAVYLVHKAYQAYCNATSEDVDNAEFN